MSIIDPSIDYLEEKVDTKFTLCILAAKRARELNAVKVAAFKIAREVAEKRFAGRNVFADGTENKEAKRNHEAYMKCLAEELKKMHVDLTEREISVALKEIAQDIITFERE